MRRVVWTAEARSSLESIAAYIEQFNPLAAQRMSARLQAAAAELIHSPERGRPAGGDRRELAVVWPYLIRYRVTAEKIYILRVRHGARRPLGS